ncbi:MAG: hypothetical protein NTV59_07305 [Chloroflexi bacterium]|jgi:hypothetical protein|nr:hypothetical protein [Chloroflexota bacterium]
MGKEKLRDGECKDKARYWILDDKSLGICKRCRARDSSRLMCLVGKIVTL